MKNVRLGKTDLYVSEVGFGGIPIIPLKFDDAVDVVRYCFEKGITFFDTANLYVDSERKIGEALEHVREKVVLATKTAKRDAGGAAKHISYSLENLKTSRIDLYQLHNVADEVALEEVLAPGGAFEAVDKARAEGKIRFIGLTSHSISMAIKACRTGLFSTVQIPFNFIENDPADELFEVAENLDMGIIAMKPLGGGLLERADLCFRFLQQYEKVIPIPGISAPEQLDEIVELYLSPRPLSETDLREIERIRSDLGRNFCHRCGYCVPCEQGVEIPDVMSFLSMKKRLAPAGVIHMTKAAMETVENCDECGECLEKCPYSLPIPDLLKENLSLFKEFIGQHG
jgi:predicted aldo/keto reductase-like oxidoreductase